HTLHGLSLAGAPGVSAIQRLYLSCIDCIGAETSGGAVHVKTIAPLDHFGRGLSLASVDRFERLSDHCCFPWLPGSLHDAFQAGDPPDDAQLAGMICLVECERAQQLAAARAPTERMRDLIGHLL